jgi:hypothetical protein
MQQNLSIWTDEHEGVVKVLTQDKSRGRKQGSRPESVRRVGAVAVGKAPLQQVVPVEGDTGAGSFVIPLLLLGSDETRDGW